ncbi:XdhC family protein [Marinobacter sp.]|uniref:XdhC family protein n=1 Tax=Marinobacter sp. TaxID=50741 RepID=UPI0025BBD76E|nr:XdhC family protein [Marinobacter sp.]|tara:strand:+ start:6521 stop:7543 length:1023 start_codon:yes stop_codon:yes gene_type:complete
MDDIPASLMAGGHESVIKDVLSWLEQGRRVWLCTIVETWGSSPRPAGSWLAVSDSGQWSGSVSGGCLEEDLLRRTAQDGAAYPVVIDYGITDNDRDDFRLPCGGRIRLLVEPLGDASNQNSAAIEHVRQLAEALIRRKPVSRQVSLQGAVALEAASATRPGVVFDGKELFHTLQPECRLLLIGAGEVARYVAEFATAADFTVILCEPRETFASGCGYQHLPLDRRLPDDLVAESFSDTWCGVLALAHDPRIDDMGLLAALQSPAFYVGAMGSVRTSEARRERLASLGLEEAALQRLRAPIGIDIPSKTPAEIAISVVADLIAARHHLRTTHEPGSSHSGK